MMNDISAKFHFLHYIASDSRWLLRSQTLQIEFYFYKQVAPLEHIYQNMCPKGSRFGEAGGEVTLSSLVEGVRMRWSKARFLEILLNDQAIAFEKWRELTFLII